MPVDWFVDDVFDLVREGTVDGGVYHNTCERPLTVREVAECISEALDLPGFEIEPTVPAERSAVELLLEKRMAFYGAYLWNGKTFLRARPFGRHVTTAALGEYLREHAREEEHRRLASAAGAR
jgi:hypothetical protein